MVKRPQQKYETLFRELRNQVADNPGTGSTLNPNNSNSNDNNSNTDDMKNELKRYLMDLNLNSLQSHAPQPQSDFIELGSTYQ